MPESSDVNILNTMLGSEFEAVAAYQVGRREPMADLRGKVAIVTGAFKGIGAAIAKGLAAADAAVAVNYASDKKGVDRTVATIRS